jgi:hypothetical protein
MLRPLLFVILLLAGLTMQAAGLPPFLLEALARFNPEIPPDLAYTVTTQRGRESAVERYDPSRPDDRQWTLVQRNHRAATAGEIARNGSYRIATAPSTRAIFRRDDIDLGSLRLVHEDPDRAEFEGRFREDGNDQMLRMLELRLTVAKQPATVEQYVLQLSAPFSPVLTVKILELRVETLLSPPTVERPALPLRVTSRFRGRVWLFKSVEEDVQTTYADFRQVIPFTPPPAVTMP